MRESAAIQPPDEDNNPCSRTALEPAFIEPLWPFVEANSESRLVQVLRDAAGTKDPVEILTRSAVARYMTGPEIGNALADLAVTGREAYAAFQSTPIGDETLSARTRARLADSEHVQVTPEAVAAAVRATLDRAYAVAWALRGPVAQRATARPPLGWIAVSGEDDTPHRPVNVPSPPFEQYDISVTVAPRTMTGTGTGAVKVKTRCFIASAAEPFPPVAILPSTRALPPDPVPRIPDGHRVILFLHGHSSSADEALPIIPEILKAGLSLGTKYSVVSFDLPNSGYSETFAHTRAAPSNATTYPGGIFDHELVRTPILDFEEDFVVAFVDALDRITPIKDRFAGVIGGSLGGNLGLRLGRRNIHAHPWLGAGIVSWSAASVWDPMIRDEIKRKGPDRCRTRWELPEVSASRADYFAEVFDRFIDPVLVRATQPEFWYSDRWAPCKQLQIREARLARRETYSANFRQWHWRLAGEQLIYSHVDRVNHFDGHTPWRYELNTARQLLMAGADDNFQGSNIFDATRTLSNRMATTPGESLFLLHTGHSIHVERPAFLAREIAKFLFTPPRERTDICFLVPLLLSQPADNSYLVPLLLSGPG
jgi:pimeloyl-ACP methyl ester carboxylesterase